MSKTAINAEDPVLLAVLRYLSEVLAEHNQGTNYARMASLYNAANTTEKISASAFEQRSAKARKNAKAIVVTDADDAKNIKASRPGGNTRKRKADTPAVTKAKKTKQDTPIAMDDDEGETMV